METTPEPVDASMSFMETLDLHFDETPAQEPVIEKQESATPEATPDSDPLDAIKSDEESTIADLPIDEADEQSPEDAADMTDKAGRRFKELRGELKTTRTELESERASRQQLESRLKELEAADNSVEELRTKVESYEQQLSVVKLEATDAYQKEVQQPLQYIVSNLDAIASKYGINPDALVDAVALNDQEAQDAAFEDLLVGVNERDKLKVYALADELTPVVAHRQKLHENVNKALAELEERQQQQEERASLERMEKRKEINDIVAKKLTQKIPFLKSDESIGFTEVANKTSQTDFESLDDANKVYSYMSGLLVPKLVKQIAQLRSELEQSFDELSDFKKATPSASAGGLMSSSSKQPTSFLDAINHALGS